VQKEHEASYVVSVRVSLRNLAMIGKFLQESGLYTPAKPGGAMSAALKMFADSLKASALVKPPENDDEALITIGTLRYPLDQLEKQLNIQQRVADRESLREETITMLGASAKGLTELQKAMRGSPDAVKKIEALITGSVPENFTEAERTRLAAEQASNIEMLKQAGILEEE